MTCLLEHKVAEPVLADREGLARHKAATILLFASGIVRSKDPLLIAHDIVRVYALNCRNLVERQAGRGILTGTARQRLRAEATEQECKGAGTMSTGRRHHLVWYSLAEPRVADDPVRELSGPVRSATKLPSRPRSRSTYSIDGVALAQHLRMNDVLPDRCVDEARRVRWLHIQVHVDGPVL